MVSVCPGSRPTVVTRPVPGADPSQKDSSRLLPARPSVSASPPSTAGGPRHSALESHCLGPHPGDSSGLNTGGKNRHDGIATCQPVPGVTGLQQEHRSGSTSAIGTIPVPRGSRSRPALAVRKTVGDEQNQGRAVRAIHGTSFRPAFPGATPRGMAGMAVLRPIFPLRLERYRPGHITRGFTGERREGRPGTRRMTGMTSRVRIPTAPNEAGLQRRIPAPASTLSAEADLSLPADPGSSTTTGCRC